MKPDIKALVDEVMYYDWDRKQIILREIEGDDLHNKRYAGKPVRLYKNKRTGLYACHLRFGGSTYVITIQHLLWLLASGSRTNHMVYFADGNHENQSLDNVKCTPYLYYRFLHEPDNGIVKLPSGQWQGVLYRTEFTKPTRSPKFDTEGEARAWRLRQFKSLGLAWEKTAQQAWDERHGKGDRN